MLKIGVTGGIGSGKSIICQVFELLGIPVFYADAEAKKLMLEDEKLKSAISNTFGAASYLADGNLNRTYLAKIVFNDENQLAKLNKLVHPAVFKAFKQWAESQTAAYVVKEAALLFESGSYRLCDKNILVTAPEALKIARIIRRDHITEEEVRARMARQMSDEEKLPMADIVLENDEQKLLIPQILKLHEQFLRGGAAK
jgi:dephospho-CoA kinase